VDRESRRMVEVAVVAVLSRVADMRLIRTVRRTIVRTMTARTMTASLCAPRTSVFGTSVLGTSVLGTSVGERGRL
jgi:hypothetical protein